MHLQETMLPNTSKTHGLADHPEKLKAPGVANMNSRAEINQTLQRIAAFDAMHPGPLQIGI